MTPITDQILWTSPDLLSNKSFSSAWSRGLSLVESNADIYVAMSQYVADASIAFISSQESDDQSRLSGGVGIEIFGP